MKRLTISLWVALTLVGCKTDKPELTDSGNLPCTDCPTTSTTTTGSTTGTTDTAPVEDCVAAGFRGPTSGLQGQALWDELTVLTAPHSCTNYSSATTYMFTRMHKVNDEVECVYTGRTTPVTTAKPDATDMNTEHTWPQSLGAGEVPAKCDLHHLYPTDSDANSRRAAFPFGVVTGSVDWRPDPGDWQSGAVWQPGDSQLGNDAAGNTVFEPRDVHKGNVARSMLYFSARYEIALSADQVALFKGWHNDDPVDAIELEHTWLIAEEQNIANPLVVCPDLVEAL